MRLVPIVLLTLLWPLVPLSALAQGQVRDSLLQEYRKGAPSPKLLNDLCWAHVFNQPDSALLFGRKALALARQRKDVGNEATAFNRMGVAYDVKHMPDSALLFYHQAVTLSEGPGGEPATLAGALNNIGLIHWNLGDLAKSVEYYVRSAELFEKLDNRKGLANTYNNIGLVLWEDENLKEALAYSLKALKLRQALGDRYGIGASYSNIGLLHGEIGDIDSAIYYLQLSIPIKIEEKDDYGLAKSYHNLASEFNKQKRLDEAMTYFKKALEISTRLGNDRASASTLYYIGVLLYKQKDLAGGLENLDNSLKLIDPSQDARLYWKVLRQKALVLRDQSDHRASNELLLRMDEMKDSVLTLEKSQALEELETKYRTAVKDRRIEEQERQVAQASLLAERRNNYIVMLLSALTIVLLGGFGYVQASRRKAQHERDTAIISEREAGLRAVITATEDERKRIAKDLHDGVVQGLTGLKMRLQNQLRRASLSADEQEGLQETSVLLDESINELRSISHQMMPRALSELGLAPVLEDLLEKAFGHSDIRYTFEQHRLDGQRFEEHIEVSLYRITQELINNIIKHSGAKAVSVQLLRTSGLLVLVVEDNGKGFRYEDATNRNGIGLMNISSRAKALNGEVNYSPSPQQGTVATIRIPIA